MGGAMTDVAGTSRVAAHIESLPILPFHRRLFGQVAIGLFFDVFDLYVSAAVAGALVAGGWASIDEIAPLTSLTLAGMIAGSLCAGIIGDRLGRRFAFRWGLVLVGLSSLVAAAAPNIETLVIARMFTGLGLGVEAVLAYAAFGEFLSRRYRGRWLGLVAMTANVGVIAAALAGYLIIPAFGWRWLFVIGAIGAAIGWFVRRDMPESPRWLESRGRHEEAWAELARYGVPVSGGDTPLVVAPGPPAIAERSTNLARALIVAITMNGALYISIFAFLTWLPSIMVSQGVGLPRSLLMNLLMSCGALLGTACGGLLSDFFGRRRSIVCLAGASAVLGIAFPLMPDTQWQIFAGFCLYATIYALAVASVSIYAPELFPTELRLRGCGTAVAVGRSFAIAAPFALPPLLAAYGLQGVTLILAVILSIEILIVLSLGWETRLKE